MQAQHHFRQTRIAPTPSGFLHLGNLYSFLLTAALAREAGANILLRIDDLDRERVTDAFVADIFETLSFMGIVWHNGPTDAADFRNHYSQQHRMPRYHNTLQQLAAEGLVFACTCSRTDVLRLRPDGVYPGTCRHRNLPLDTPGACWRLKTDQMGTVTVTTTEGTVTEPLPPEMQHFVVRRKDGIPAYQLASVVDDVHFGVDFVVRGTDLWASTLAQQCLTCLPHLAPYRNTVFYHHPLITGTDGQKLSKSAGATSIQYLRKAGFTREEILAMVGG